MKKYLKLLSLALAAAVCVLAFCVPASAAALFGGGNGYYYNLKSNGTAVLAKYNGTGGNLEIPSNVYLYTVNAIADDTFMNKTNVTGVTVPDSVETIGRRAFYGCTELTPLATINAPNVLLDDFLTMEKCSDNTSIGLPPPGTVATVVDPETNEVLPQGEEGMLVVTGPQVMKGYLKDDEKTAGVVIEREGRRWYKTGDKCVLTDEGFVQILGRYSRFAKLGGEMISLTAVELRIAETKILDNCEFAVTAVPDSVKGERIVLLVKGDADAEDISRKLRKSGMPPLMLPGSVFCVDGIPKLGSGKWDFNGMKKLAMEMVESR